MTSLRFLFVNCARRDRLSQRLVDVRFIRRRRRRYRYCRCNVGRKIVHILTGRVD